MLTICAMEMHQFSKLINFHMKCKDRLLQAKFTLHLFEFDSPEQMINKKLHELFITKIVGLQWDKVYDTVIFDMKKLETLMIIKPTIRKFIQFFTAIYDLLGLSNPFVVSFVVFVLVFQKFCITKVNWDAILSQDILKVWHNIILDLRIVIVLRWYRNLKSAKRVELHGFQTLPSVFTVVAFALVSQVKMGRLIHH